jgi:hypothetical protein
MSSEKESDRILRAPSVQLKLRAPHVGQSDAKRQKLRKEDVNKDAKSAQVIDRKRSGLALML